MLRRHPTLYTAAAATVLAATTVGAQSIRIGAPATDASVAHPLIVREFLRASGQPFGTIDAELAIEAQRQLRDLGEMAIIEPARMSLHARLAPDPDATKLNVSQVTPNALRVLGIRPATGRDFLDADLAGPVPVAIVSAGVWQKHFEGRGAFPRIYRDDAAAVPRPVWVIGSLPPGALSENPELDPDTDVLVASTIRFDRLPNNGRWFAPILRLKPGATVAMAERSLAAASRTVAVTRPGDPRQAFGVRLETLRR